MLSILLLDKAKASEHDNAAIYNTSTCLSSAMGALLPYLTASCCQEAAPLELIVRSHTSER